MAAAWLLQFLWGVLSQAGVFVVMLLVAWIVTVATLGPVRLLQRLRIPRPIASGLVYLVVLGIAGASLFPTIAAVNPTATLSALALRAAFAPEGMFIYQLNGAAAGQSVFHIHMHVVPRYEGVPLRSHEEGMEDNAVLAEQAEQVRAALERLASSA